MSHSDFPTVERHCDVAVIGGSAAGLAAALQLGRQRRSVIVIDAGEPRNAPASHMHGYLGRDGTPPGELAADGREEVRSYGGEVLTGRAERVTRGEDGGFRVELVDGHTVVARRVLAATGLLDVLPDIDGLAEYWGEDVIHCPFCHGFEVRDQHVVAVLTHQMGLHPVRLFRRLTDTLTVVVHADSDVDESELDELRAAGVHIRSGTVRRVVTGSDGRLTGLELDNGELLDADAVSITPGFHPRSEPFTSLGLPSSAHPNGLGEIVPTDTSGATAIAGLYAAGNITDPSQQVAQAAADGSRVGGMLSFSLADDDITAAARPSANEADWDHRYTGELMWSGNPNGTLVAEISGVAPGYALDVGAGEGGDVVWLAEEGWAVTANDISQRALDRVDAEAKKRGLDIATHHADANARAPFASAAFDLVVAQYASIPRTPDARGIGNVLDAVADGGTLLVVGHDLEPMREPIDPHEHSRPFDPDAYVRVDDFAAAIAESSEWEVEVHQKRPRPSGSATDSHHVDDVVLRARRRKG